MPTFSQEIDFCLPSRVPRDREVYVRPIVFRLLSLVVLSRCWSLAAWTFRNGNLEGIWAYRSPCHWYTAREDLYDVKTSMRRLVYHREVSMDFLQWAGLLVFPYTPAHAPDVAIAIASSSDNRSEYWMQTLLIMHNLKVEGRAHVVIQIRSVESCVVHCLGHILELWALRST